MVRMENLSRRGLICAAASVGVATPLVIEEAADAAGTALIATSKVPVGGGVVLTGRKLVVTQPTAGVFHVFSAVCTHRGCTVSDVTDQRIDCPCHGSQFAITDGSVVTGPARRSLPKRSFEIKKGKLFLTP